MAVPLCWAAMILGLYSVPGFDLKYEDPWQWVGVDKFAHIGIFAILVTTLIVAFKKQSNSRLYRIHAKKYALIYSIIYGGILELYQGQLFVQRSSDIMDFAANIIGSFMGVLIFHIIYGINLSRS